MKMLLLPSYVRAVTLILLTSSPCFARAPGKTPKPIVYHDTVISSVDAKSINITADGVPKAYVITARTEITFKGQRALIADLQPGMAVSVTADTNKTEASRVAANPLPVHPPNK